MHGQPLLPALFGLLAVLLCIVAFTDLKSRLIPNWINITIAVLAPVMWLVSGIPVWPDMAIQLGLAVAVFCVCAGFFALRQMGGGDLKLLTALSLWFTPLPMLNLLLIMSITGGVLTLIAFSEHRLTARTGHVRTPYGVAIAFAGLWSIYERYLNHFG